MRDISERILAQKSQDELEKNRKLTTIIQEHIEDERRSLARELHDELGQYVSAIKIFARALLVLSPPEYLLNLSSFSSGSMLQVL